MGFESLEKIVSECKKKNVLFPDLILEDDCKERQVQKEESFATMKNMFLAMKHADENYDGSLKSASGLVGGDGEKMQKLIQQGTCLSGSFTSKAMMRALKMGESNACMKRIVAAPTAGACGVLPAVLLSYEEVFGETEENLVKSLYVAAGIGEVIATRAFISGAQGGCQAEIGSASAMAAGALCYLHGGDANQIVHGATLALKSLLGLTCDPVAGLVEVPCVKRNVIGAVNAISSCDLAMAGIESAIEPDEVIDTMRNIGRSLPESLRETGEGGLAKTTTAKEILKVLRK